MAAWLPVPAFLAAIVVLQLFFDHAAYPAPYLLIGLNFCFLTIGSAVIVSLVSRSFMKTGSPGLLLLGCGAICSGAAGAVGVVSGLLVSHDSAVNVNVTISIHNTCVWMSSFCHLAGVALFSRWYVRRERRRVLLVAACVASVVAIAYTTFAGVSGWLPPFFVQGSGGTVVRSCVLGAAVGFFLLTALLLAGMSRPGVSRFGCWYALALLLTAIGLFGVMIQTHFDGVVNWVSRSAQYLGGLYMLVAAFATREEVDAGLLSGHRETVRHPVGVAVALVVTAFVIRVVFLDVLGSRAEFSTLYPAVMLSALYGGLTSGFLATLLSIAMLAYFWVPAAGNDLTNVISVSIFTVVGLMISFLSDGYIRAQAKAAAAEAEAMAAAEARRAEFALSRYLLTSQFARDPLLLMTIEGHIVEANHAAEELYGYSREELLEMNIRAFRSDSDVHSLPAQMKAAREEGILFETIHQKSDGTVFPVEVNSRAVVVDGKDMLLSVIRDISERRAGEEALREAEQSLRQAYERVEAMVGERTKEVQAKESLLRTVLEHLPVGCVLADQAGAITYSNPAAAEIWGLPKESGLVGQSGMRARSFGSEAVLPRQAWGVASVVATGRTFPGTLLDIDTFDGAKKTILCSAAPVSSPDGTLVGAVGVAEDVTLQQELQKQLLHAQKLESVGALAGGVAHDFNNLLMAICGYTEAVYEELDEGELRANLEQVLTAGEKARELTHKLLTFSRQQAMETRVVDLGDVTRNVMRLLARTIPEDIDVRMSLTSDPLPVSGNPSQIEQVLMNIIINARDVMPDGGTLCIENGTVAAHEAGIAGGDGTFVFTRIADTGTGIPPAIIGRIFDPYFTTKETGKGTGLGLAIAYGIARQHGGLISVSSAEGKGSVFTLLLPVAAQEEKAEQKRAAPQLPGGSETVLIVEDDETVRSYLTLTLRRAGYDVIVADNGDAAIDMFAGRNVSAVISDVIMPKMNGMEMYTRIKELNPAVKIIFVSGYSSDIVNRKGIDEKEFRFLQKPVSREVLLRTLRTSLDS